MCFYIQNVKSSISYACQIQYCTFCCYCCLYVVVWGDRGCDSFLFKYILVAAIAANSPSIFPETDKSSLRGNMELNFLRNSSCGIIVHSLYIKSIFLFIHMQSLCLGRESSKVDSNNEIYSKWECCNKIRKYNPEKIARSLPFPKKFACFKRSLCVTYDDDVLWCNKSSSKSYA